MKVNRIYSLVPSLIVVTSYTVTFKALSINLGTFELGRPIFRHWNWVTSLSVSITFHFAVLRIIEILPKFFPNINNSSNSSHEPESILTAICRNTIFLGLAIYYLPYAIPHISLSKVACHILALAVIILGTLATTILDAAKSTREDEVHLENQGEFGFFQGFLIGFLNGFPKGLRQGFLVALLLIPMIFLFSYIIGAL